MIALGIVLALVLTVALPAQATDPATGTWKLNLDKSKYEPANLAPKSGVGQVEAMEGGLRFVNDGVDSSGNPTHNEWSGKFDGKDNVVKGDPTRDTASIKKIDAYTYEITSKKAGKVVTTNRAVYARDGKSRTQTITGTNAKGQTMKNIIVSDKQ
jgi:hypothetical protein